MFINPQLMANREISWQLHLAGTARFCDYFVPIRRVLRAASLPQHLADRGQPHLGNVLMFAGIIVIVQFEFCCSFITRHYGCYSGLHTCLSMVNIGRLLLDPNFKKISSIGKYLRLIVMYCTTPTAESQPCLSYSVLTTQVPLVDTF